MKIIKETLIIKNSNIVLCSKRHSGLQLLEMENLLLTQPITNLVF